MNKLNIKRMGLAFGATASVFYLGCLLLMAILGEEATVVFFNSLLHGLDTASVIRMDVPLWEEILGIVSIFILGWISGACIAFIYNKSTGKNEF